MAKEKEKHGGGAGEAARKFVGGAVDLVHDRWYLMLPAGIVGGGFLAGASFPGAIAAGGAVALYGAVRAAALLTDFPKGLAAKHKFG